jgi:hypothetical protein
VKGGKNWGPRIVICKNVARLLEKFPLCKFISQPKSLVIFEKGERERELSKLGGQKRFLCAISM